MTIDQIAALGDLLADTYDDVATGLAQLGLYEEAANVRTRLWRHCHLKQCRECGLWHTSAHDCIENTTL